MAKYDYQITNVRRFARLTSRHHQHQSQQPVTGCKCHSRAVKSTSAFDRQILVSLTRMDNITYISDDIWSIASS